MARPGGVEDAEARELELAIAAAIASDEAGKLPPPLQSPSQSPPPSPTTRSLTSSWGMAGVGAIAGTIGVITLFAVPFLVVPVLPRAKQVPLLSPPCTAAHHAPPPPCTAANMRRRHHAPTPPCAAATMHRRPPSSHTMPWPPPSTVPPPCTAAATMRATRPPCTAPPTVDCGGTAACCIWA